jgi:transcriptional regulator with XRE-family HTH domain
MRRRVRRRVDEEDSALYATIAGQVASQRTRRKLTQAELADLCGTTQSAVARLESGVRPPRIDTLRRIANALDCELEVLLRPRTKTGGRSTT